MSNRIDQLKARVCRITCMLLVGLLLQVPVSAQPPVKSYTIKDGRMFISLSRHLKEASLDSFILQYNLADLALKDFFKTNSPDSLKKLGWKLEQNNNDLLVISKKLFGLDKLNDPGERIMFADKSNSLDARFPAVSSSLIYGYNQFRNKYPFAVKDSVMRFFLRNNKQSKKVILAGSFSNWSPDSIVMLRTDSGWIADIKLSPGKYWYKFVVDGNWETDKDNRLNENDGLGNMNSVVYKTNAVFRLPGYTNAKRVYLSGSFNDWDPSGLLMNKTMDGWELPLYLAEGTHTYRFVVDRRWMADPVNPDKLPNEYHEFNSVLRIGKPYLFYLEGYTHAKKVTLAGSFNKWRQDELFMKKTATGWELPYTLGPGNYEYRFVVDDKWINRQGNNGSGNAFFIIQPNYTFRLKGAARAKNVYLAGDFNNWSPDTYAMQKDGDDWIFTVHLSPGKHVYKFVVDGKWIIDPSNKLWEQNEHNTGNSVIWIDDKDKRK